MAKVSFKWDYDPDTFTVSVTEKESDTRVTYNAMEFFEDDDVPRQFSNVAARTFLYGIGKLLQDRNSQTDPEDKMAGFDTVWNQLVSGEWERKRKGGTRTVAPVVEAIAKRKDVSVAQAQKAYAALDDEMKKAIAANLAADIEAIEATRKEAETPDLSDLA